MLVFTSRPNFRYFSCLILPDISGFHNNKICFWFQIFVSCFFFSNFALVSKFRWHQIMDKISTDNPTACLTYVPSIPKGLLRPNNPNCRPLRLPLHTGAASSSSVCRLSAASGQRTGRLGPPLAAPPVRSAPARRYLFHMLWQTEYHNLFESRSLCLPPTPSFYPLPPGLVFGGCWPCFPLPPPTHNQPEDVQSRAWLCNSYPYICGYVTSGRCLGIQ